MTSHLSCHGYVKERSCVLCDVGTEAKETDLIIEIYCVVYEIRAEAEEIVE